MGLKSMAFTGYRPQKLPWGNNEETPECMKLKKALHEFISSAVEQGYVKFMTGMALGVDTMCAKEIISRKESGENLILSAAVPFAGQADAWSPKDRKTYDSILASCDEVNVLSQRYTQFCMQQRNQFMVDSCDALMAVFDGKKGGTYQTLSYAADKGKILYIIDPLYPVVKKLEKI